MKYSVVCDPTRKNAWHIARHGIGGILYIVATSRTEHQASDIAKAMDAYSPGNNAELSEHVEQRANHGKTWADRTNQKRKRAA